MPTFVRTIGTMHTHARATICSLAMCTVHCRNNKKLDKSPVERETESCENPLRIFAVYLRMANFAENDYQVAFRDENDEILWTLSVSLNSLVVIIIVVAR